MPAPHNPFLEGLEIGRRLWAARTHCKRGHKYTSETVYINPTTGARQCRECLKITRLNIKPMTKEWRRKYVKQWRNRNVDKTKEIDRRYSLKQSFGITIEQYDDMLSKQGGVCSICKRTCSSGKRLAVDHCHKTGVIRGLLCSKCNQGIGHFNDDPNLLFSAISYLAKESNKERHQDGLC